MKISVLVITTALLTVISSAKADESKACADAALKKEWSEALSPCTAAAKRGDSSAQFYLGKLYQDGIVVMQDHVEAIKWYELSVQQGSMAAAFVLIGYTRKCYSPLIETPELLSWCKSVAEKGDSSAQFNLGFMYSNGQGVAQDYREAVRLYRLAAAQGVVEAQHNLGVMYSNGQGVAQDYVRAHMWFNIAAVTGNPDSVKNREIAAGRMTREQIAQAQELARQCIAKNYKNCN